MNIDPILRQRIREGRKTEHRIPTRKGQDSPIKPCRYQGGRAYWIGNLQIQISAVRRQRLADMTELDARREGFHALEDFRTDWVLRHERAWVKRVEWRLWTAALAEHGDALDDLPAVDDEAVQARFDRVAHREVWVLTFATDFPLYLTPAARPAGSELGYTENPLKGMPNEPEVIDAATVDGLPVSWEARERWQKARARRERAYLDLSLGEKIRLAQELGESGVDVSGPLREAERQLNRALRRGLGRKAA